MSLQEALLQNISEHKKDIYTFLGKVVAYDTTNYITRGDELACQQFIQNEFSHLGAEATLYNVDDIPSASVHPDYEKNRGMEIRPNVTVCLPAAPEYRKTAKSIMLTSHTDTMPAGDLAQWKTNPFEMVIKDGKAYGLGISDNKYGSAISYAIYRAFSECHLRLKHNLYLTMVSDEEYFGGNGSLLACLKYPCDVYVNLDGCDFETQIAGLGGSCFVLSAKCEKETSSAEAVVDALYHARMALQDFGRRRLEEVESNPLYTGSEHAKSAYRLMEFGCGTFGTNVDIGKLAIVVYSSLPKAQIISELEDVYEQLVKPYFEKNGISSEGFVQIVRYIQYGKTKDTKSATRLRDIMQTLSGREIIMRGACLSDLDIYLRNGSENSFNVGIIREFKLEGGAHKPNEYICCEEFETLAKALTLFTAEWCEAEIDA